MVSACTSTLYPALSTRADESRSGRRIRLLVTTFVTASALMTLAACQQETSTPYASAAGSSASSSSSAFSSSPSVRSKELEQAVSAINKSATSKGYKLHTLTVDEVVSWVKGAQNFEFFRADREAFMSKIIQGFAASIKFELREPSKGGKGQPEILIEPFNLTIIKGKNFVSYESYQKGLLAPDFDLAEEPFRGPVVPTNTTLGLPVAARVTPISVAGKSLPKSAHRAALKVEVRLTPDSLDRAAEYFGTGFDRTATRSRLVALLGKAPSIWVNAAAILPNWVGKQVNTFPARGDSDVCFGAAREFYAQKQDARHNVSTEASNMLLANHYCLLGRDVVPTFGDYLNKPNLHAARYVLRDPASGRDVVFSVQSGGEAPYRFSWLDEDFSSDPFAGKPDPTVLKTQVDVWRRCR